jgi:gas vesicle protein
MSPLITVDSLFKNKIMSSGKLLLGVLAGVAAGALLGILFAPDKGWNTRKKISKKGEDYAEALKEKFKEFLDEFSEKFEEVKEDVSDFTDPGTSKSGKTGKDPKAAKV